MSFLGFRYGLSWFGAFSPVLLSPPSQASHRLMHAENRFQQRVTKFQLSPDCRTRRTNAYAIMTHRLCTLPQPCFDSSRASDSEKRWGTLSDSEVPDIKIMTRMSDTEPCPILLTRSSFYLSCAGWTTYIQVVGVRLAPCLQIQDSCLQKSF